MEISNIETSKTVPIYLTSISYTTVSRFNLFPNRTIRFFFLWSLGTIENIILYNNTITALVNCVH